MATFQGYQPLSAASREIRILTALPALLSSSTFKCELSTVSLNTQPHYEALSYVWRSPQTPREIELNKQRFSVTQNLYSALRALRRHRIKRVIWVDAVCINRSDVPERNSQVQARIHADSPERMAEWLANACIGRSKAQAKSWQEFALLLLRPYWTRVWIYQEMVLASSATIYCGKDSISWDDMETVAFAMDAHENLLRGIEPPFNSPRAVGVYHWFRNAALARAQRRAVGLLGAPMLLDALCTQRSANGTHPRDKFYSLLGVVKDHFVGLPELPSGPDLTHHQEDRESRHTLRVPEPRTQQRPPFLAPGLEHQAHQRPIQNPDQWGQIHFASPVYAMFYMEPPDDDTLVVSGAYVDTASQVGNEHTYGCDWEELKGNWKSLAVTCLWTFESAPEAGPCYLTTESIPDAFFQTLKMGRIDDDTDHEPQDLMKVEVARIEAIERRRFFVTDKGFMALEPAETRIDDRIVVIWGAHVPFVLRKDVDDDTHAVVGETYVHGLMNGEALDEDRREAFHTMMGRRFSMETFS
ncbi:hypothetical protein N658DRAFT_557945 [Parathielavia hyrcaniae]|uniref:Heterokaryon incompatibility domain-containing protein n=1 Tax=Parathielavia hyrcaniae TaxID=113614 RepID=A0AAN6Q4S9_9PEZI|nr:hypothetical protein N658DRAFT_557945 [Parathielavia hyrcaniae]